MIPNLYPGEYDITVTGLPAGFYLKSARLGDEDILNRHVQFTGLESRTLEVSISPNGGKLEGLAVNGTRQPVLGSQVVLIPDKNRDRPDLFRSAFSGPDGRFSIEGIPPVDYKLVAWEALQPYAFFAPELLRQDEERGAPLAVSESSTQTVDVVSIPVEARPIR